MIRFLHLVAITGLLGSAGYAYSTKYESLFYAETLTKLKTKLAREREAIAIAKAEWALMTRPDRLQAIADKHLDLQQMQIGQLARISELPNRPQRGDEIARKLELLGMETGSISPAKDRKPQDAKPPVTVKPGATAASPKPASPAKPADTKTADAKPAAPRPASPSSDLKSLFDKLLGSSNAPAR